MAPLENPVGNLRDGSLASLWNSEDLRRIRLNMLEDKPSEHCRRCYEHDAVGHSMRQRMNESFGHHLPLVDETKPDGTVERLNMAYLDIRFSNLCNFACRTCGHLLSSRWYDETVVLEGLDGPRILKAARHDENLWNDLEPLLDTVEEVYFAGGEPLLMEEHYRILSRLLEKGRSKVRLLYSTNLSELKFRSTDVTDLWRQFEHVRVAGSLDAPGARGEYIRKGQDWAQTVENRRRMLERCPNVQFFLSPTLSVMNVFDLPVLHRDWVEQGLVKIDDLWINFLFDPEFYRVQILPPSLKARAVASYREHLEGFLVPRGAVQGRTMFEGAIQFIEAQDLSHLRRAFWEHTTVLDQLRKESFLELFPELAELKDA